MSNFGHLVRRLFFSFLQAPPKNCNSEQAENENSRLLEYQMPSIPRLLYRILIIIANSPGED